jgi:hypothetical protein
MKLKTSTHGTGCAFATALAANLPQGPHLDPAWLSQTNDQRSKLCNHLAGRKFQEVAEAARAAPPGKNYAPLGDLAVSPSVSRSWVRQG